MTTNELNWRASDGSRHATQQEAWDADPMKGKRSMNTWEARFDPYRVLANQKGTEQ